MNVARADAYSFEAFATIHLFVTRLPEPVTLPATRSDYANQFVEKIGDVRSERVIKRARRECEPKRARTWRCHRDGCGG
jgi:hypothetical protein